MPIIIKESDISCIGFRPGRNTGKASSPTEPSNFHDQRILEAGRTQRQASTLSLLTHYR